MSPVGERRAAVHPYLPKNMQYAETKIRQNAETKNTQNAKSVN